MSVILDTHALSWWIAGHPELPQRHRDIIVARTEPIFVSAVSGWQIGVKVKLGKWPEAAVLVPDLTAKVRAKGFAVLDLTLADAERAGLLDLVHKDPFDRLLAA